MSSTPYEIRYSSYQLAQKRLMEQYDAQINTIKSKKSHGINEVPEFPSHEMILKEAQKIYKFISTK